MFQFEGNKGVLGTPLAEVFSIGVSPLHDGAIYEVYGTIEVKDDHEDTIVLYNRKGPEFISESSNLSLEQPTRPISAAKQFTILLDLKQMNDHTEFIKGSYTWSARAPTMYDNCLSTCVQGALGVATIYYTVLTVATQATVSAHLRKKGIKKGVRIYGTLIAQYGENYNLVANDNEKGHSRIILFEKTVDNPCYMKGGYIPLSRSLLAVPAYSTLQIVADTWCIDSDNHTESMSGIIDFPPEANINMEKHVDDNHCFSLRVKWSLAKMSPSSVMSRGSYTCFKGGHLVEVFSVRTFCSSLCDQKAREIHGTVYGGDCKDFEFYKREMNKSERELTDNRIRLSGPERCIMGYDYGFRLSLYEKCQQLEICDGYWGNRPAFRCDYYDGRVSAAIKGKDGYGVLHFTVFDDSVQANVEVGLVNGGGPDTAVHGSLIVSYGNYDYGSEYVKKYFRTRLLEVSEENPVYLEGESFCKVPLSRSVVAAPTNCLLLVEADLSCSTMTFKGNAVFHPRLGGVKYQVIHEAGGGPDLYLKIRWVNIIHAPFSEIARPRPG